MCTSGGNLNTLGKSYEVRGNGPDGGHWGDKPLYGWVTHLPAGWIFTPAPGTLDAPDSRFYADFVDALPCWTGGFVKATMVRSHVARRRLSVVTITPPSCAIRSARPRAYVCILCG
jgi:hypothetical protein